jgi:transcriptional regulator with XRE-family HTH domain
MSNSACVRQRSGAGQLDPGQKLERRAAAVGKCDHDGYRGSPTAPAVKTYRLEQSARLLPAATADRLLTAYVVQDILEAEREATTMTNFERIRKELGPARRKKIEARAAQLIAEEMTRQELRRARKLTQVRMAKALGITQDGVSRLEKRTDLLLSTLRQYIEAMGGSLSLVAEFPDRPPVVLSGIAEGSPQDFHQQNPRARDAGEERKNTTRG